MTYDSTPFVALDGNSISLSIVAGLRDRPDVARIRLSGLTQNLAILEPSRKCYEVDTLEPLARLSHLERLTMRGVLPKTGRLDPIRRRATVYNRFSKRIGPESVRAVGVAR